jgi:methylmalonyl-CoA/ethylmalonyl-CoA epimerase
MTTPRPASSQVTALGQVALTVANLHRSVAFYRDAVGLPFLFGAGPSLAFLAMGGVRLMLSTPEKELAPGGSTVLYLRVDDIAAAHAAMRTRGVPFVDEPHLVAEMADHDLWMCFFRDPDGHTMALMSERARGAR